MTDQARASQAEVAAADAAGAPAAEPAALSSPTLSHLRHVARAMRPRQWTKNLIVFMALLFSIGDRWEASDPSSWAPLLGWTALTFLFFSFVASANYLVNDIVDVEKDRKHPAKRRRPIAAGQLSPRAAGIWAFGLAAVALGGAFALSGPLTWKVGAALSGYTVLMVSYSYYLKNLVLVDMMAISSGFVLRAMTGALAIDVPISEWLYVVTALGALFLITNKRRAELALLEGDAAAHRPILKEYSLPMLDQIGAVVTASTIIAYGLYTFTADNLPENNAMMLTIPFVLYGLFRYLFLVHRRNLGGSPEEVLIRDWPLILDILLWLAAAGTILAVYGD